MDKYSQLVELREIYREMDDEGKKMMLTAARMLFNVQSTIDDNQLPAQNVTQTITQTGAEEIEVKHGKKFRTRRFSGILGFLMIGLLLLFSACFFWATLISPALLAFGDTPLIVLRIIITALFGMFLIGAGLVRFLLRKFTVLWMLLAIGAGILYVDPAILTDLIGFAIFVLIVSVHVINWKRNKAAVTV